MTRAPEPSELDLHLSVAKVLEKFDSGRFVWTHLPMGGKRPAATAAILKRMGVKRGWPDFIFIDLDGSLRFLELKTMEGPLGTHQFDFFKAMRARKIDCQVTRSLTRAIAILSKWGVIKINLSRRAA